MLFFFKQKTAYEMRISDWSSDVCSSDLRDRLVEQALGGGHRHQGRDLRAAARLAEDGDITGIAAEGRDVALDPSQRGDQVELPHLATVGKARLTPREIEIAEREDAVVDGEQDAVAPRREPCAVADRVGASACQTGARR